MKKFIFLLLVASLVLLIATSVSANTYRIVVDKAYKMLFLFKDNSIESVFPVCIGEHTPDKETPTGYYKIVNKVFDPVWYFEGKVYKPYKFNKENGLGVVWMGWNLPSYGLHGTNEPFSIGFANSHGCVRMENKDALFIANTISLGTPIEVKEGTVSALSKHLEIINLLYSIATVLNNTK